MYSAFVAMGFIPFVLGRGKISKDFGLGCLRGRRRSQAPRPPFLCHSMAAFIIGVATQWQTLAQGERARLRQALVPELLEFMPETSRKRHPEPVVRRPF